jgi:hypothetical protein
VIFKLLVPPLLKENRREGGRSPPPPLGHWRRLPSKRREGGRVGGEGGKFNVVTLYERILTCFIIYRNANLIFLTLFVKCIFGKKNYEFYVGKIMKIEERLCDVLHLKRTKLKQLFFWY